MALNIYDKNGLLKLTVYPSDSSTHQHAIQEDNVLNLSFIIPEYHLLDVNDYVEWDGSRFRIIEQYVPQQKSTVEWDYNCKFYGIESLIKCGLVLKLVDNEMQPVFSLTAPARQHMALLVDNINRIFETTDFKVGEVIATENIYIDYNCAYISDGLSELAKQAGTEWWFDGMTVNLIRCEHGEEITLGYRNGLTKLERTTANNVKFFTRLYPLGSTRNIDFSKYGYPRLQLPGGQKYVEQNVDTYGIIEHSEETSFSHIYPRRVGTVSSVRSEEKTGTDGNPFKIYYFKDTDIPFDPNDYEIGGWVKQVTFESGELNGREFEVNYNSDTQEFEIITQFPEYGDQIPNDILMPKPDDKYVLWNLRMPDEYYGLAEQEFREAVDAYMADNNLDKFVYKAPTDYIEIIKREIKLVIGQRIKLESNDFFPGIGYRNSRITRITRKINYPTQIDIEISDVLSVGKVTALENSVSEIKTIIESTRDGLPDIIKTWENTPASDWNLFSSSRTIKEIISEIQSRALSRLYEDIASGHITFKEGLTSEGETLFKKGFTAHDFAIFYKGIVKEYLSSQVFVPGFLGEGFKIYDENGKWTAEFDNLVVRQSMTVYELIISKIRAVNGGLVISPANGKIKTVSTTNGNPAYYVLGIEGDMTFVAGDLVRCQVFASNNTRSYWVEVKQVNGDTILCLVSDFNGVAPAVGDDLVQMGNTTNKARQGVIYMTAAEDGKPRIQILDGVNTTNLNGKNKTILGCLDGITDTAFPAEYQPGGYGLYSDNVFLKGLFVLSSGKTVEQDTADKIGAIQVGGRNLLRNSGKWRAAGWNDGIRDNGGGYTIDTGVTFNGMSTVATFVGAGLMHPWLLIENGVEYTYSAMVRCNETITGNEVVPLHYWSGLNYQNQGKITILSHDTSVVANVWKRIYIVFKLTGDANSFWPFFFRGNNGTTKYWIAYMKLEKGNRATDWTPAQEDVDAEINQAKHDAADAQTSADSANNLLADIASDNKLTASEKQDTKKEWDSIISEYSKNITQANKFGVPTTAYTAAYNALYSYITPLLSSLTTTTNITGTTFRATFKAYYDARTDLLNAISVKAKELADNAKNEAGAVRTELKTEILAVSDKIELSVKESKEYASNTSLIGKGKMLHRDPTFKDGINNVGEYNNLGNGTVTITRVSGVAGNPNDSGYCLKIVTTGNATPGHGGFHFHNQTRANAILITRIIANIPVGCNIGWYSNPIGNGGKQEWLTSQAGTGIWTEYISKVTCGSSGDFSSTNFFALTGGTLPTWYVAFATVYDVTGVDDIPTRGEISDTYTTKTTTESQFQVLSSQISSKVSQTDFNVLGQRLNSAESAIIQLPNQISAAVSETKLYTDNVVSNVQVGGRNNFKKTTLIGAHSEAPIIKRDETLAPNGLYLVGTQSCLSGLRIYNVITSNGDWTISFDIRGTQSTALRAFVMDICDKGSKEVYLTSDNGWRHVEFTVNVTNYSANVYNFIDFERIGWLEICLRNIKVEKGNRATDWTPAPEDVQGSIDQVKTEAENAQQSANNAQTSANSANTLLTDIASDNKLTASEKQDTKKEWDSIVSEYSKNITQANKFGVSTTAYTTAYNILYGYITPLLSSLTTTSDITGTTFRATFKAYYDTRTDLLNAISVKAKELADNAKNEASNAQKEAETVRTEYKSGFDILSGQISSKVSQTDFNALGQRVSSAESTITQLPDKITLAVSGIQIGGRNLIVGSKINETSSDYGFGFKQVELNAGGTYTLSANGRVDQQALNDGKYLKIFIHLPNWSYSKAMDIYSLKDTTSSITFIAPNTGIYQISSYLYPSDGSRTGKVAVNWYQLEKGNKATDWTAAPEDLQIGGRNLLRNSGKWRAAGWNGGIENNGGGYTIDTAVTFNGMSTVATFVGAGLMHPWLLIENGVEYTYSAMVRCNETITGNGAVPLHYWSGLNYQNQGKITVLSHDTSVVANVWKRIYIVFKLTGDANTFRPFFFRGDNGTTKYWIAHMKLEKGNRATDWTPAQEDVDAEIALRPTTEEIKSQIEVTKNGVKIFGKNNSLTGIMTFESLAPELKENGKINSTLIDGDKIITGTLLASKIAATDITTGKLTVTDGAKIGDFILSGNSLTATYATASSGTLNTKINGGLIQVSTQSNGGIRTVQLQAVATSGAPLISASATIPGINSIALWLHASGGTSNNVAIDINRGCIRGIRLGVQRASSSITMDEKYNFLALSDGTTDPTVYLPSNPEKGQIVFVANRNRATTISGNGRQIYRTGSLVSSTQVTGAGRMYILIYNGSDWAFGYLSN